jgi:hypothetical protein
MVSLFVPQNQVEFCLSVAPQNQPCGVDTGHASRSSVLLHLKASLDRVFQSDLKTGGYATTGGARDKLKMDESMRWAVSHPATLSLPFSMY